MTERLQEADVVIIGLGAAGGMAAYPLAMSGLDVVGLEAGPRLSARDFPADEIGHDIRNWMGPKYNAEIPTHRLNSSAEAGRPRIAIRMVNAVGGTSIHAGAEVWRLRPWNFSARTATIERYGAGAIPEGSTLADWPLDYEELEPYYDHVEHMTGVSGQAGNINGAIDQRGNIREAPRSRPYPLPPLRRSGFTELMADGARALGWHPFPGPAAIHSEPYDGRPACEYCGFCNFRGCHVDAKASTFLNAIPRAEATGTFRIVTAARVLEIVCDRTPRATGVRYVSGGLDYFQPAKVVVLASYVYENVRLLLLSVSRAFPNGLGNNGGQVGRHFMAHIFRGFYGVFPGRRLNVFSGPTAQRTSIDDFADDEFDHEGIGFIAGGLLDAHMEQKPIALARNTPPHLPRWGSEWKAWLKRNGNSVGNVFSQVDCLPYEDNFIDLDPGAKDALGLPVVRVTFDLHQQEQLRAEYMSNKCRGWLEAAGAEQTWMVSPPIPIAVHAHAYGGTRMGDDPDRSVTDRFGFLHEVPNVAVLGGSCFPTAGSHNPTLTIQALAWRTADHLVDAWRSISNP